MVTVDPAGALPAITARPPRVTRTTSKEGTNFGAVTPRGFPRRLSSEPSPLKFLDFPSFFVSFASDLSLPVYTFFSAGLVNIFVPSGGGQWAVQGPVVLESALKLGVPLNKAIMAFAYGDQITNMLQPFWALPLLAITKLKAREILPYTLVLMLLGMLVYITGLLLI